MLSAKDGAYDPDEVIAKKITSSSVSSTAKKDFFNITLPNRTVYINSKKRSSSTPIIVKWLAENSTDSAAPEAARYLSTFGYINKSEATTLLNVLSTSENSVLNKNIFTLISNKLNTDKQNAPSIEEILAKFNNSKEQAANREILFQLAVSTGSESLIPYIKKELNSANAPKILPLLSSWPDDKITSLLLDNLEATKPSDSTLTLRTRYTSTIAKIITNPQNLNSVKPLQYCTRFLEATTNDSELTDYISAIVSFPATEESKFWKTKTFKAAVAKATTTSLKKRIRKLITDNK